MVMSSMITSSSMSMATSTAMSMPMMVFTTSSTTPLYTTRWTPSTPSAYAGTCIFLILLASTLRLLFAFKSIVEARWAAQSRNRRFIVVKGRSTEAGRIDSDPDSVKGSLITVNGVEENVKVVRNQRKGVAAWRLSVDVPRAGITMVIAGVAYLL
jgi:hypothetical protein